MKALGVFLAILFSARVRCDCFCGRGVFPSGPSASATRLSDFVTFLDFSSRRLNSLRLSFPGSEVPIAVSPLSSLSFAGKNNSPTVELFFRLASVVPLKLSVSKRGETSFFVSFSELRNSATEKGLTFHEEELSIDGSADLMNRFCRFFYVGINELLLKNFEFDLDQLLIAFSDEEVPRPKGCLSENREFNFYMRKQLIVDQAASAQANLDLVGGEKVSVGEDEKKIFGDELDQVIALIDAQEKELKNLDSPLPRITLETSLEAGLKTMIKFSENASPASNKIGEGSVSPVGKLSETPKKEANPSQRNVEQALVVESMRKPVSKKSGKLVFIRDKSVSVEQEGLSTFVVVEEGEGSGPGSVEEIMREEAELGSANQIFNCDTFSSGASKYYIGLFDSIVPSKQRALVKQTKESDVGGESDESREDTSVMKVFSDLLDAKMNELKVVFDSRVSRDLEKALAKGQQVLKKVNGFNPLAPLGLHQRQEVLKWIVGTHETVVRQFPDAYFVVYSDFSVFFEQKGVSAAAALGRVKGELRKTTERDGLVTFAQRGDSASLSLRVGELSVPLGSVQFDLEGHNLEQPTQTELNE